VARALGEFMILRGTYEDECQSR